MPTKLTKAALTRTLGALIKTNRGTLERRAIYSNLIEFATQDPKLLTERIIGLKRAAKSSNPEEAKNAKKHLYHITRILLQVDHPLARKAVRGIGKFKPPEPTLSTVLAQIVDSDLAELGKIPRGSGRKKIFRRSISSLGTMALPQIRKSLNRIKKNVKSNDSKVAKEALNELGHLTRTLGGIDHPESLRLLLELSKFENTDINRAAVKSLYELSANPTAQAWLGQISVSDRDPAIRLYAKQCLAKKVGSFALDLELRQRLLPISLEAKLKLLDEHYRQKTVGKEVKLAYFKSIIDDPHLTKGETGRSVIRKCADLIGRTLVESGSQEIVNTLNSLLPIRATRKDKIMNENEGDHKVLGIIMENAGIGKFQLVAGQKYKERIPTATSKDGLPAGQIRNLCYKYDVEVPSRFKKQRARGGTLKKLEQKKTKRAARKKMRQTPITVGKPVGGPKKHKSGKKAKNKET